MKTKQKKIHGVAFMISVLSKKQREDADRLSSLEERVSKLEKPVFSPNWTIGDPVNPSYTTTCASTEPKQECTYNCEFDGNGILRKRTPIQPKEDTKELRKELYTMFMVHPEWYGLENATNKLIDKIIALIKE